LALETFGVVEVFRMPSFWRSLALEAVEMFSFWKWLALEVFSKVIGGKKSLRATSKGIHYFKAFNLFILVLNRICKGSLLFLTWLLLLKYSLLRACY